VNRDVQQKPDQQADDKSRRGGRPAAGGAPRLADLQHTVGNRAVSGLVATMLQRDTGTPTTTPPVSGTTTTGGSGTPPPTTPPTPTRPPDLQRALTDRTPEAINAVRDFGPATDPERLSLIQAMCGGALDTAGAATVRRIWESFGSRLPQVASDNNTLWDQCNQRGAHLPDSLLGTGIGHRDIRYTETVGGWQYGVHGIYDYRVVHDAIQVKVPINFAPDSGVSAPVDTWFGYIRSTWNHYSAVNRDNPTEKKAIDFQPTQSGGGQRVQVTAGDGRANAGRWYVGDSRAANTIPHEFGHLIGLEDEYELRHSDYVRVTGEEPQAGSGDRAGAQRIATAMHDALYQGEHWYERHKTAVRRRMDAVTRVLTANTIPRYYSTPQSRQVAQEYQRAYSHELADDIVRQIDADPGDRGVFRDWREGVCGVFEYTNTSLMGNPDYQPSPPDPSRATAGHEQHAVQPRHVRQFSTLVQDFVRHGTWNPVEDH
jgi:hypothetical protein